MRESETGGFPLIIYSLSLGNRAASTANLSLLAPGPFEADGCLSSLSACAPPAGSYIFKHGPHMCMSALSTTWGPHTLAEVMG